MINLRDIKVLLLKNGYKNERYKNTILFILHNRGYTMKLFTKIILIINILILVSISFISLNQPTYSYEEVSFEPQNPRMIYNHTTNVTDSTTEMLANVVYDTKTVQVPVPEPTYSIEMADETRDQLNEDWSSEHEFGYCVEGYVSRKGDNKTYVITGIDSYKEGTKSSISSIKCYSDLGTLHSHPQHTPQWSPEDKKAFEGYVKNQKNKIMMIMHDVNQFVIYSEKHLDEKIQPKTVVF